MYEHHSAGALNYFPCRYGKSRVLFRGPKQPLSGPFCAFLGGSETYGKYVEAPFPALIEAATGQSMVNMGVVNAGLGVFSGDDAILNVTDQAAVTVVQVLGAQNLSNRFYAVHPRRNDRFLKATAMLRAIYREVDFTDMHFNRHMLRSLIEVSPERFALIEDELKLVWVRQMRALAKRIDGKTVLLWVSNRRPEDESEGTEMEYDPLFVDRQMIDALRPCFSDYVEVVASTAARAEGLGGMQVPELEVAVAAQMPGPALHGEVAEALAPVLTRMMP